MSEAEFFQSLSLPGALLLSVCAICVTAFIIFVMRDL